MPFKRQSSSMVVLVALERVRLARSQALRSLHAWGSREEWPGEAGHSAGQRGREAEWRVCSSFAGAPTYRALWGMLRRS